MNSVEVHAELIALRQVVSFLLAREMANEDSNLADIHQAFVAGIIDDVSRTGFGNSSEARVAELVVAQAYERVFSKASRIYALLRPSAPG